MGMYIRDRFTLNSIFSGQEMHPVFRRFKTTLVFSGMRTAKEGQISQEGLSE